MDMCMDALQPVMQLGMHFAANFRHQTCLNTYLHIWGKGEILRMLFKTELFL